MTTDELADRIANARLAKARAIVAQLRHTGIPLDPSRLSDGQIDLAARVAGVRKPSEHSIALVRELLADTEGAAS